jgi:serine/threonine-protein kinase HipA
MRTMKRKCLYCYQPVDGKGEFHEKCNKKFFGSAEPPILTYSVNEMAELAKQVVERSVAVPGVQPKLSMSMIKERSGSPESRLTVVGALGGNYIFKPPSEFFSEMPENEHVTMRIAEACGINVVESSLIRLKSGELSYITKRIDRTAKGEKIHMIDMFQITEAFDKYKSSMEKVGKAVSEYSANTVLDLLYLFELTLFSFLTGNNDMHLKNFSMIKTGSG